MEDIQILNEERKTYFIGPKKKRIELYPLSLSEYYEEFVPRFLELLRFFFLKNEKINLPAGKTWNRKKYMANLRGQLKRVFSFAIARREFFQLLRKVGYLRFGYRYFNKRVKPVELIDIFLRVYKFNVDDFKKKILEALEQIMGSSQLLQTYTGQSSTVAGSSRLPGKKDGSSKKELRPRFRTCGKLKSRS